MGVCGSKPKGCVLVKGKMKLPKKRRRQGKRRMKKTHSSINKNRIEPSDPKGNSESWFDTDGVIDSDGEDDFYSIQDDVSQTGSLSNLVTPRFASQVSFDNSGTDFQPNFDDPQIEAKNQALLDKSSSRCEDENARTNETGPFQSCGFLSNALRPCLACDECLDVKKKSQNIGGSSMRKRLLLTASFKWKEGQENQILSMAKPIIQRPIAGSQVMRTPFEKKMSESWSPVDPNTFKVRGQNYTRDKKKELASNYAAYIPFGVDVFLSPRKINHVARHVELPAVDSHGEIPPILVVNLQIPLYQAAIFQNEYDGAGVNYVFYFKLSENYSEDLPVHFRENLKRLIANETERIKGFPMDTNASYRERLKILARVANSEDLQLSSGERKLMNAYNEKPVLSRPQHEFYLGENYFEIDLDIHKFSYIARKGFESFQDRIKHCIFDFGLTIQGNKPEDLPECMLCCLRLNEIDYTKYCKLSL